MIKICGACAVGDVMAPGEYHELPLTHNRVAFLERTQQYLQQFPRKRLDSMKLLRHNGIVYHLDAASFNEADGTVIICKSCYIPLSLTLSEQVSIQLEHWHSTTMGLSLPLYRSFR